MSDSLLDRRSQFQETQSFFDRLARLKGFDLEQLKEPEKRVDLIQQTSADEFLELMTVANAKLRGEYLRWKRDFAGGDHRAAVISGIMDSPDLESPPHQEEEFSAFYAQMQEAITPETIGLWSTKLYTAIIFLHMFPDGNGRLGRNAFTFLSTGAMPQEEYIANRPSLIGEYCKAVNEAAVHGMLEKNGATRFKYMKLGGLNMSNTYSAEERATLNEYSELGLVSRLKFIAAKRVGIVEARAPEGDVDSVAQCFGNGRVYGFEGTPNENGYGQGYSYDAKAWTTEEIHSFKIELEKVKSEWFQEALKAVDDSPDLTQVWLEIALSIPNPAFMKINTLLKVIRSLSDEAQAKAILDADPKMIGRSDEFKTAYLEDLKKALDAHPEIIQRVEKLAT